MVVPFPGAAFFSVEVQMTTTNEIINKMLIAIGEGGVSTTNTLHPSVQTAQRLLDSENVEFQSRGWWFNKERALKLVQDSSGRVTVPQNALAMSVVGVADKTPTEKLRYAKRGQYIYDTYKHTNVLNTYVYVDITVNLDIEDMPHVAANYLMRKCEERMYLDDDGDSFKTEKLERYRMEAWQLLKAQELTILAASALDNPTARSLNAGYAGGGGNVHIYGGGQR